MSPVQMSVLMCLAVGLVHGGILTTGPNTEYQLAVNYHSQQHEASSRVSSSSETRTAADTVETVADPQERVAAPAVEEEPEQDVAETTTIIPAAPTTQAPSSTTPESSQALEPQAPLVAAAVSRVSNSRSGGKVSFAYHGETEHASSSSSRVSQTLTSAGQSGQQIEFGAPSATFYQAAELQQLAPAPLQQLAPAHIQQITPAQLQQLAPAQQLAEHPHLLTHGAAVLTPAQTIVHLPHLHRQPVREHAFSVNVSNAKYGYGYTIRGVQHAHPLVPHY